MLEIIAVEPDVGLFGKHDEFGFGNMEVGVFLSLSIINVKKRITLLHMHIHMFPVSLLNFSLHFLL